MRPIEDDGDDGSASLNKQFASGELGRLDYLVSHCSGPPITWPDSRSTISSGEYPSSRSTVCESSPKSGPALLRRVGVSEKRIGEPSCRTLPSVGCGASQKKSLSTSCWSWKTCS